MDGVLGWQKALGDAFEGFLDANAFVVRQEFEIARQEEVGVGEAAHWRAGVGEVGGAAFSETVRLFGVDAADGDGEGA